MKPPTSATMFGRTGRVSSQVADLQCNIEFAENVSSLSPVAVVHVHYIPMKDVFLPYDRVKKCMHS